MPTNAVAPEHHFVSGAVGHSVAPSRATRILKRAKQLRRCVKISSLGKYSTERVKKFNEYCRHTSLRRAILVKVIMPCPALLLAIIAESIPLQNPADGWKSNYGAWIRLWIAIASGSAGSLFQLRASIPGLTYMKMIGITMATACVSTSMTIMAASLWVFPVPFCMFFTGVLGWALFVVAFVISMERFESNIIAAIKETVKHRIHLIVAQVVPITVYLAFSIVFTRSSSYQRIGLLVLLPVMKLILKLMIARLASNNEDSIPAVVVFSIDVFNGLYTSICMQSSGSLVTSLFVSILAISYTIFSVLEINRAARSLNNLDLLISPDDGTCQAQTAPVEQLVEIYRSNLESAKKIKLSKLLFYLEYQVLGRYIKGVVPLLYATYLLILINLPSAHYYPYTRDLPLSQLQTTLWSIVAYVLTELLSLISLQILVRRKLGLSLLHQLAFVLETEVESVQGRLIIWIVILFQLPLVHFGADFGFNFAPA